MTILLVANYAPDRQQSMLRFAECLERELPKEGLSVEVIRPEPILGRLRADAVGLGKWLGYVHKFVLFPWRLRRRIDQLQRGVRKPVVVHVCDHSNAVYTRHLRQVPHLVTCNDLLAVRSALREFPEHPTRWSGRQLQHIIRRGLTRAQRITCISEATRTDVLRVLSIPVERVTVTYMGLHHPYTPMPLTQAVPIVGEVLARAGNAGAGGPAQTGKSTPTLRYVLHVGGNQWYKNRVGALEIYRALRLQSPKPPALAMVGPSFTKPMRRLIDRHGLQDQVHEVTTVDNEQLRALYSAAELTLFPSLAEGFGWPILEAQACGCPVLTTGRAPMTEVGGDAALYLEPRPTGNVDEALDSAPSAWATGAAVVVAAALTEDAATRAARVQEGLRNAARFGTDKMLRAYVSLYDRCAQEHHSRTSA